MATKRTKGDLDLNFRNKDFSKMSEKGLPDPDEQSHPLKILSCFGGIGADRRALENCGYNIKAIDYIEVLPYAVLAYNRMFECGPKPQDIRIWNLHPDIVVHGSPCFVAGTKVLTTGGYKNIENISTGDYVIIGTGSDPVYKCSGTYQVINWWDNGLKNVITLTFDNHFKVTCTPNHKFLILRGSKGVWVEAKDISLNKDYVLTGRYGIRTVCSRKDAGLQNVYDIEVETVHCFEIECGIIVHNCQDFSNEGKNNINTGRSILFERVLQILDPNPVNGLPELSEKPKVVIWENVPRLAWCYKDVLNYYMDVLEEFGYISYFDILKASDYNIPQDRERVFVVSILKDIHNADKFTFPEKVTPKWTLKDFIDKTVDFNDPAVQLSEKEKDQLIILPNGTLAVKEGTKKGYKEIEDWNIVNLAFPGSKNRRGRVGTCAKTITTGPRQAIYYNGRMRMLTAKEYMRLMGYRDVDYKKMKDAGITDDQICTLAGNSICVPVLEYLFRRLAELNIIPRPEDTYAAGNKKGSKTKKRKTA